MKTRYYELKIIHTGRSAPQVDLEEDRMFDKTIETFESLDELTDYIEQRYGKNLLEKKPDRKIFINTDSETVVPIGRLYSFWNKDISHNSKSWWQTDWIEVAKVGETREFLFV